MGQATLDLPDHTQLSGINAGPLSPEALASADDLLSQLAGDDIDRLLAEADAERSKPAAAAPSPPAPPPTQTPKAIVPAVTTAVSSEAEKVADESATAAALDAILAPAIESTLNAVEKQAAAAEQAGEAAAMAAAARVSLEPSVQAVDQGLLDEAAAHVAAIMDPPAPEPEAVASPAAVADAAERQALSEPLILPTAKATGPGRLWLLVKILEWINSPMLLFSDEVREAMGKVAIVTSFNAAAVLVYVMMFHRPHH